MEIKTKTETFIGFAVRARAVKIGVNACATLKSATVKFDRSVKRRLRSPFLLPYFLTILFSILVDNKIENNVDICFLNLNGTVHPPQGQKQTFFVIAGKYA